MTLITKQIKPTFATSDADFRAAVSGIRDAFTELGWTIATAGVDPATVARPTSSSQIMGYDMFALGDSLQSSAPFFVRVGYGAAGTSSTNLGLTLKAGTAHNGALLFTGNTLPSGSSDRMIYVAGSSDTTLRACTFAGGPNRIMVSLFYGSVSNNPISFAIERSHADDGSDTDERLDVVSFFASNPEIWQIPSVGSVPGVQSKFPVLMPSAGSGVKGTDVGVFPVFPNQAGPLRNPMIGPLIHVAGDITDGSDVPVTMYGTQRIYRSRAAFPATNLSLMNRSDAALMVLVS